MQALTPDKLGFGKCPSNCESFARCVSVAAGFMDLAQAVDADLAAPVESDPENSFAVYEEQIVLNGAGYVFPEAERGCPRYIPPLAEQI